MALDFLRRETRVEPSHAELVIRVNSLSLELARAHKRIDALERQIAGAAPALEDCDSARKLMAHIGRASLGETGDTAHLPVRSALLKHANFEPMREALARKDGGSIVADERILRWLASPAKVAPEYTRFALIHSGVYSARQLAEAER